MATVKESTLKELKDLINSRFDDVDSRFDDIEKRLTVIETTLLNQQSLVQKIPDLAEKVGELKNWRQIVIILVTGSVSGLIGWLLRGGKL